jgi:hypothetical protein
MEFMTEKYTSNGPEAEVRFIETEKGGFTAIGNHYISKDGTLKPISEYSDDAEM